MQINASKLQPIRGEKKMKNTNEFTKLSKEELANFLMIYTEKREAVKELKKQCKKELEILLSNNPLENTEDNLKKARFFHVELPAIQKEINKVIRKIKYALNKEIVDASKKELWNIICTPVIDATPSMDIVVATAPSIDAPASSIVEVIETETETDPVVKTVYNTAAFIAITKDMVKDHVKNKVKNAVGNTVYCIIKDKDINDFRDITKINIKDYVRYIIESPVRNTVHKIATVENIVVNKIEDTVENIVIDTLKDTAIDTVIDTAIDTAINITKNTVIDKETDIHAVVNTIMDTAMDTDMVTAINTAIDAFMETVIDAVKDKAKDIAKAIDTEAQKKTPALNKETVAPASNTETDKEAGVTASNKDIDKEAGVTASNKDIDKEAGVTASNKDIDKVKKNVMDEVKNISRIIIRSDVMEAIIEAIEAIEATDTTTINRIICKLTDIKKTLLAKDFVKGIVKDKVISETIYYVYQIQSVNDRVFDTIKDKVEDMKTVKDKVKDMEAVIDAGIEILMETVKDKIIEILAGTDKDTDIDKIILKVRGSVMDTVIDTIYNKAKDIDTVIETVIETVYNTAKDIFKVIDKIIVEVKNKVINNPGTIVYKIVKNKNTDKDKVIETVKDKAIDIAMEIVKDKVIDKDIDIDKVIETVIDKIKNMVKTMDEETEREKCRTRIEELLKEVKEKKDEFTYIKFYKNRNLDKLHKTFKENGISEEFLKFKEELASIFKNDNEKEQETYRMPVTLPKAYYKPLYISHCR